VFRSVEPLQKKRGGNPNFFCVAELKEGRRVGGERGLDAGRGVSG